MKKIYFTFFISFVLKASSAMALVLSGITISSLNIDRTIGEFLFISTNIAPTVHGCHTDPNWNFVLPITTQLDKQLHTELLAAMTAGKKVDIEGSGDCTTFSTIENVKRIRVYGQ